MDKSEHMSKEHAASVARITQAEKNKLSPQSAADHKAAEHEFHAALEAHEEMFGKPFKRNGVWQ